MKQSGRMVRLSEGHSNVINVPGVFGRITQGVITKDDMNMVNMVNMVVYDHMSNSRH